MGRWVCITWKTSRPKRWSSAIPSSRKGRAPTSSTTQSSTGCAGAIRSFGRLEEALRAAGRSKLRLKTVFTAPPDVLAQFQKTPYAARLRAMGGRLSYICPLMYMNNPLCKSMPVVTNSNKLRTYTSARYYTDEAITNLLTKGGADNG